MSQYNPDDSDCVIEEKDITCINLDNSQDSDCVIEENNITCITLDKTEDGQQMNTVAINDDMEEGEVSADDNNIADHKETVCEINFNSKVQFETFGCHIIDTLREKFSAIFPGKILVTNVEELEECIILKLDLEGIPIPAPLNEQTTALDVKNNAPFEKEDSPDLSGISELFMIDTEPAAKIETDKVPSYKRSIKDVLLDVEAAAHKKLKAEENVFKLKKTNSCFNCGETGHSIRECTRPHNAKRIKNAKRACFKTERYHVDVEQRFAHLKPGCVSDKLREAMGLRKGEIPFFFYRMRVLGYPPAWLEEAKVEHSGITLFNSDGAKVLHSDEDEGEIDPVNHKYNISKIYDFPGFNQDPGENFFDDYQFHNVPPFNKMQLKDEFIKTLGDNVLKGYKRKKLKDFPNAHSDDNMCETSMREVTDMEIEDPETTTIGEVQFTRPPPPPEQPPPTPPPPSTPPLACVSPPNTNDIEQRSAISQSPSLIELEKQKQKLLNELQANTTVVEIEDSLIDEIIELDDDCQNFETSKEFDKETTAVEQNTSEQIQKLSDTSTLQENDNGSLTTVIKESIMGTPVLKFSPYDNLPNGDNFKVGVSDVINFENLPDSTGKYEQMKEVIKKVRTCITKLQSED